MKKVLKIIKDRMKKRKENKKDSKKKKKKKFAVLRKIFFWLIILALLIWAFTYFGKKFYGTSSTASNYLVIEPVVKGDISSSFTTQGTIKAEQKQDLNVYKKTHRLDVVNIKNGSSVKKGDVLYVFDSSDYNNSIQRAYINYKKSLVNYDNQKALTAINQNLVNSEVALTELQRTLKRKQDEVKEAREKFFSADLEPIYGESKEDYYKTKPTISGTYKSEKEGQYEIEVYKSSTESGYSFRYKGLESGVGSIVFGEEQDLGENGLKITFAKDAVENDDEWTLKVPNTDHEDYQDNKKEYKEAIEDLVDYYTKNKAELLASEQNVKYQEKLSQENFDLRESKISVSEALKSYNDAKDNQEELTIEAPFDGTIDGMSNVVVGETPKSTDDLMEFGTLISNDFVVTFSLSIASLNKIKQNQEVSVDVDMGVETKTVKAVIEQIGALPSNGLYPVTAKIQNTEEIYLREGLSATVNIIKDSKQDVVRVPNQAIAYDGDKRYVMKVIQILTTENNSIGDIVSLNENKVTTEKTYIEAGLSGAIYTEVISGLNVGDKIVTTVTQQSGDNEEEMMGVEGEGDGPGSGGGPRGPRN